MKLIMNICRSISLLIMLSKSLTIFCQIGLSDQYKSNLYEKTNFDLLLNFYENGTYCLYFEQSLDDEMVETNLLSFGNYKTVLNSIILKDYKSRSMIFLHRDNDLLKVDKGYDFLINSFFKKTISNRNDCDYVVDTIAVTYLDSVSIYSSRTIPGTFVEPIFGSQIIILSNKRFIFKCYVLQNSNSRITLLSGTWSLSGNCIKLYDTSSKGIYYIGLGSPKTIKNISLPILGEGEELTKIEN